MSSIKVKSKDGHMPSGFKTDYIDKVIRLDNGFNKTVEKVICWEPDILRPNLFIRTNLYPPLHKPRSIFPNWKLLPAKVKLMAMDDEPLNFQVCKIM